MPSIRRVMRWIFAIVSGVKMVPSFTTTATATVAEPPNFEANLSWAWMNGWSGHCARASVSMRTIGPGSRASRTASTPFRIG